jgi:hypothetical protein
MQAPTQPEYRLLLPLPNEEGEYIAVSDEVKENGVAIIPNGNLIVMTPHEMLHYLDSQSNATKGIIASTKFIHPSIPLMRKEQIVFDNEVEVFAKAYGKKVSDIHAKKDLTHDELIWLIGGSIVGFKEGYSKRAETYKYTEEDLRKAIELSFTEKEGADRLWSIDEIIKSLNKPKEWIVTFEMENLYVKGNYSNVCSICKKEFHNTDKLGFVCPDHPFPKLYKEGENTYVNITSIKSI